MNIKVSKPKIDLTQTHVLHRDEKGCWMYQSEDGVWRVFHHDSHFIYTRDYVGENGFICPIAYFKLVCHLPR